MKLLGLRKVLRLAGQGTQTKGKIFTGDQVQEFAIDENFPRMENISYLSSSGTLGKLSFFEYTFPDLRPPSKAKSAFPPDE